MALSSIGSNATEEFFETILYGTAYAEAQDALRGATEDVENDLLQDAITSASSIMIAGAMSVLIRKQEDLISGIFEKTGAYIGAILSSELLGRVKNKLRGLRGMKLFRKLGFAQTTFSDKVALAQLASNYNMNHVGSIRAKTGVVNPYSDLQSKKDYILNKENHNFQIGTEKAKSYQ
ncbi:hypothetical protein [Sulfurimonas sp. NWX367]|uniref:hypothetical protein n=1 Tax=Sulfurimonas sp. NWX367 TaxID=2925413 RepID=UPI003204DFCB